MLNPPGARVNENRATARDFAAERILECGDCVAALGVSDLSDESHGESAHADRANSTERRNAAFMNVPKSKSGDKVAALQIPKVG